MSVDHPDVSDLSELLADAELRHGAWDAAGRALILTFVCPGPVLDDEDEDEEDEEDEDDDGPGGLTVALGLSGVTALAVSYDPAAPDQRPSGFAPPDDLVIGGLDPWPLDARDADAILDEATACDDAELAARTDWLVGDLGSLARAEHRLVLDADAGAPRIRRWITIGFAQASPRADDLPLPWRAWMEQRGPVDRAEPDDPPPAASALALAPHDVPAELLAPVLAWVEREPFCPGSIARWWLEGRRASVVAVGVAHIPADDDDPAREVDATASFALHRTSAGWTIRSVTTTTTWSR